VSLRYYDAQERYLEAVNREETDTRLKNGTDGERELSISPEAANVLDGYIQANRESVTDEHHPPVRLRLDPAVCHWAGLPS
jgi:hypothetical protein